LVPALSGSASNLTEFGSRPAWSPDGTKIAFQSDSIGDLGQNAFDARVPSTIWIVPAQGGTPMQITRPGNPTGGHGAPSWSPDGKRIAFSNTSFEIWSVSANGNDPRRLVGGHVGYLPFVYDPIFSPDGQALYFAGGGNGWGVFRVAISPTGYPLGEPERIKNTGPILYKHLNLSADGKSLAYSAISLASNIWSIRYSLGTNEALGPPEPLTHDTNVRKLLPRFSPDGKRIAYTVGQIGPGSHIWVVDADGKNARLLTATSSWDSSWFPDGRRLAFTAPQEGKEFLESLDIEAGRRERLREIDRDWTSIRLSPDGKQIAFDSRQGGTTSIWTAPAEGGPAKQWTFDKEMMGWPFWSRDGRFIAFEMKRGDDIHLGIIPSAGGTLIQLTSDHGEAYGGDWLPDEDRIVFAAWRNGVWNLWCVSRRDKSEKQITNYTKTNCYVRSPSLSRRGDRIAYEYSETTGNIYMMHLK
jgi:Tol biopolymer transport system component